MECKFALRAMSVLLILAGLYCFPAAHALYVNQKLITGQIAPSLLVRMIDFTGFVLLVFAFAFNVLSKLAGGRMGKFAVRGLCLIVSFAPFLVGMAFFLSSVIIPGTAMRLWGFRHTAANIVLVMAVLQLVATAIMLFKRQWIFASASIMFSIILFLSSRMALLSVVSGFMIG